MYYLASSVAVVGVEDRPPFGDLGCALRHRPTFVRDAGLSDPGEHEALGEAVLGHARHVPCPGQRATRVYNDLC